MDHVVAVQRPRPGQGIGVEDPHITALHECMGPMAQGTAGIIRRRRELERH